MTEEESKSALTRSQSEPLASAPSSPREGGSLYEEMIHEMLRLQQTEYQRMLQKGTRDRGCPKGLVLSFPERELEEETGDRQCMVCIENYVKGDKVRTMPCLHFFHSKCIDEWLLSRGKTCPICKFDIRNNYNA